MAKRKKSFWGEVKRRKVFRAASLYLVAIWTLSLGAAELFPAFGIPDWGVRLFVIASVLGFPLVVIGAWVFEITSEGVVLDHVARNQRDRNDLTHAEVPSATTTLALTRHIEASWEDDSGQHRQEFFDGFVIGRDPGAELRIDDPRISRLHARVSYERGQWWIEDLSSRNGTAVDGTLINEKLVLSEVTEVRLYEGARPIRLAIQPSSDDAMVQQPDEAEARSSPAAGPGR